MKRVLLTGLIVVGGSLLVAPAATEAAVVVTVTNLGTPNSTTATMPGYTAYRVSLATTGGGEVITAVDAGGPAGNPRGFFPSASTFFSQRATLDPDLGSRTLTPQNAAQNNTNALSFDTHFLPAASTRIDVSTPTEDNDGTNRSGQPVDTATGDFGGGTFLKGTFGIQAASQASTLDLVYLVLPSGQAATGTLEVSTSASATAFPVTVAVPEPTGLAAAGVAVAGVLARRRRSRTR